MGNMTTVYVGKYGTILRHESRYVNRHGAKKQTSKPCHATYRMHAIA